MVESKDCVAKLVEELTALKEDPNSKQIAYFSSFMQDLNEDAMEVVGSMAKGMLLLEPFQAEFTWRSSQTHTVTRIGFGSTHAHYLTSAASQGQTIRTGMLNLI